jgi:hypothetical protein
MLTLSRSLDETLQTVLMFVLAALLCLYVLVAKLDYILNGINILNVDVSGFNRNLRYAV